VKNWETRYRRLQRRSTSADKRGPKVMKRDNERNYAKIVINVSPEFK
jgi:hypothetical protein